MKTIITSWGSNKHDKKVKTRSRRHQTRHAIRKGCTDALPSIGGNAKD